MNSLSNLFCNALSRYGCQVRPFDDRVEFENDYLKGKITLKKPFTVTWKCRSGFEVFDVPVAPGNSSVQFDSAGAILNFIQRRLLK